MNLRIMETLHKVYEKLGSIGDKIYEKLNLVSFAKDQRAVSEGKVVGIGVGLYVTAYVFVPALIELGNKTASMTGTSGSLMTTLLPVLAVVGLATMFIKGRRR